LIKKPSFLICGKWAFFYLRLFPKGSDEVVDYFGARTLEGLSNFIDSNGKENGKPAGAAAAEEVN
jgi:hypothetical protein